jgi:hypothetical protein
VGDVPNTTDPTAGGLELGGEVGDVLNTTDPTAGGLELGGAVGERIAFTDATAGGLELGGAVGERIAFTDATAGGLRAGGAAGDNFRPEPAYVRAMTSGDSSAGVVLPTRVAGDILIAMLNVPSGAFTANAGWVFKSGDTGSPSGTKCLCYAKTSDGTDSVPITGTSYSYVIFSIAGFTGSGALHQSHSTVAGTTITSGGFTVGGWVLALEAWGSSLNQTSWTPPAGWTTAVGSGSGGWLIAGWKFLPAATYAGTAVPVGTSCSWATAGIVFF